jgi:HEPN domain-containing protein
MPILFLRLKIPFQREKMTGASALTFSHWLPLGQENGIEIVENNIKLVLWFDIKSTWWAHQPKEEEIQKYVNLPAHRINADLEINNLPEDLAKYIKTRDFTQPVREEERTFQADYESLGEQVLRVVLTRFNRLVAYARARKGQYWLIEYEPNYDRLHTFFDYFEAKAHFDEEHWFTFQPSVGDRITVRMQSETRHVCESEWPEVRNFVVANNRSPLGGELLTHAEQLLESGHRRVSLTEAVTALEITLSDFSENVNANAAFGSKMAERLAVSTLKEQVRRIGFSDSIRYLLPLILPEETLPNNVIKGCHDAITQRNLVVHNGQRDVNERDLRKYLSSIRRCCEILKSLTVYD